MSPLPIHLILKMQRATSFAEFTNAELYDLGVEAIAILRADLIKRYGDQLPPSMKEDPRVVVLRCCPGHDEPLGNDVIDGPLPTVKNCSLCRDELLRRRPDLFYYFSEKL
jgi:hypothetical protein